MKTLFICIVSFAAVHYLLGTLGGLGAVSIVFFALALSIFGMVGLGEKENDIEIIQQ